MSHYTSNIGGKIINFIGPAGIPIPIEIGNTVPTDTLNMIASIEGALFATAFILFLRKL